MAWVARGTMSDRREDITKSNVKCYIYNSKTTLPEEPPVVVEPIIPIPPVVVPPTPVVTPPAVEHPVAPVTPPVVTPVAPVTPTPPLVAEPTVPTPPAVIVPTVPTEPVQSMIHKEVTLELDDDVLSDIAKHFITQNNLAITLVSKSPLKVGEAATITLEIKNKKSGEKYSGLLPFAFKILSTNDTFQSSISNIQLINN